MLKWKLHFILVCIFFVVLNENDILFWIFQYYCMWPDRPQYMDLWVTQKNLCGPWRFVFEYPWFRTSGRACVVLSSFNSCQKLTKPSRPHTPPRLKPTANCLYPTALFPLVWPVHQKICIEHTLQRAASSIVACMFCACVRWNKRVALVLCIKKAAGREVYACSSLYFRSKRNLTISDKNSCIPNM